MAITSDGTMHAWGWGGSVGGESLLSGSYRSNGGQLGLGHDLDCWQPTPVTKLICSNADGQHIVVPHWRAVQASCGFNHSVAVIELL